MIIKIAEYAVKDKEIDTIVVAIKHLIDAVKKNEPETRYETFRKRDLHTFVHLMEFSNEKALRRHVKAEYTRRFVTTLYACCEIEPFFSDLLPLPAETEWSGVR